MVAGILLILRKVQADCLAACGFQPIFARAIYRIAATWDSVISDEIDDVVQETFLKLGAGRQDAILRANLTSEAATTAYLTVMAANTARSGSYRPGNFPHSGLSAQRQGRREPDLPPHFHRKERDCV
jgi:DNA-directed RNA polymerase specialized sigma24 family protein